MDERRLHVAVVQMESANRDLVGNLARAERGTEDAARRGAGLVLLPELFSTGFELDAHAWASAEPQRGPTETWLRRTARRLRLHLGGSYLEARGEDFFNTFALATPDGEIAGRVRKSHPCSIEAFVFRGGHDAHVIDTAIGRIGVAICYEGTLRAVWDEILAGDPDLVLMPMSAPTPMKGLPYPQRRIDAYLAAFRDGATDTAAAFGVPVLMANKWGEWRTALPGWLPAQHSRFPGFSHIADSDGREAARVGAGEGVGVAEVALVPERKRLVLPAARECFRPWIFDVPAEFRLFGCFEALGRRWYRRHRERAAAAKRVAAQAYDAARGTR